MKRLIVFASLAMFTGFATASDKPLAWPQFRGPQGSGVADAENPPVEFGPEKNVKWKVPAPAGLSSPIVAGDKLVITAFEDGKLFTIAYDRATGKEAWRADAKAEKIEAFHKTEGSPASSTPASDGERIVSYFGSCGLIGYDMTGKELWRYEMTPASSPGDFGSGVSPILADGIVILVRDQMKDAKICAVDAASGELKWEKPRRSPASYSTPVVWDTPAGKQIAVAGHAQMVGYDLATGEEKWTVNGIPSSCCSSPMIAEGTLYFAGAGGAGDEDFQMPKYDDLLKQLDKDEDGALGREESEKAFEGFFDNQDANKDGKVTRDEWDTVIKFMNEGKSTAFALEPGGSGDVTDTHRIWEQTKGLPFVPSAIVYRGQFLMVKDGGLVTAYDAKTGDELYQDRSVGGGNYYASPVAAGGNIYFTSLDGEITVLKAESDEPVVVAKNEKLGEKTAATPAIADDTLYVRSANHLWAFAERK